MVKHSVDTDEIKARHHAARIRRFWRDAGYVVNVWAEKLPSKPDGASRSHAAGPHWVVRSDLINGHPQRKIEP
jgi:hypothetical protein